MVVTRENKLPETPRRAAVDEFYIHMVLDKREPQLRLAPEASGATCDLRALAKPSVRLKIDPLHDG